MTAGIWDMTIEQGATYSQYLRYEDADGNPIDLYNHRAKLTVRDTYGGVELISLSTENGRIALDAETGAITLGISAADTAALPAPATGVYDLELYNGPTTTRLLEGRVTISPEVTT